MVSDCGTNFTSQLTREMLGSLGCSPRFNSPGHPKASSMVERFNQTFKNMLSHVVQKHQCQWHKYVPLMVWALREVPNVTTGISPYMLVYGRVPRSPLAVLRETWARERELPPGLGSISSTFGTNLGQQPRITAGNNRLVMLGGIISVTIIRSSTRVTRLLYWPKRVVESCLINGKARNGSQSDV